MAPEESDSMSEMESPPAPPEELPAYLVDALENQNPERLRLASNYALTLAGWKERQAEEELTAQADHDPKDIPDEWDEEEWENALKEAQDKAGTSSKKGTVTIKTINDNDYYYLQWREGDKIKSQYIAPVHPSDG
ncbi:hypothetical protein [Halorientalis marina]|jgi:hypothetical protein|uniref:hypothetical protein n=1 Tax=Halorientalis marina TaxID=2931976 RepID=UPI001FF4F91E|nr:hypothetical protein [Halorientalis marina]